jgi:glycogen debranching enzyme
MEAEAPFTILTEAERPATPVRVLKDGDTFAVFDVQGDLLAEPGSQHGLYHGGTRFLSGLALLLGARPALLLSSTVSDDNVVFTADLTNGDIKMGPRLVLAHGAVHLLRSRVLSGGALIERVLLTNHSLQRLEVPLAWRLAADFADIFEVRGTTRQARGVSTSTVTHDGAWWRYRGLDDVDRVTEVTYARRPDGVDDRTVFYRLLVEPHQSTSIELAIRCDPREDEARATRFDTAVATRRRRETADDSLACRIVTSNIGLNRWIRRSSADLRMMTTDTPFGPYPYAGIPWFATPFGRDGIITALQTLWTDPELARGVLAFLASTQAMEHDDARDAQPGKIVHEMRTGEMARLGEVPFGRYYGSADATPLFVALAHAYFDRAGDAAFIDRLWPHLTAALEWMDRYGDVDGDGFIEYARRSPTGLAQQGWKDSWDAVFHDDGRLADGPIAVCEVQSYAFAAWRGAAALATARGDRRSADDFRDRALRLQARVDEAFWLEDLGTYALALDGAKRPCRVRTSNAGHILFWGLAPGPRAQRVANTLLDEASFSGWGIRTVAAGSERYNPMSYHNGSVWPHDNAIVAAGFGRYGMSDAAVRVFDAIFDLSQAVDLNRLPELVCGFPRRPGNAPTLYPVACAPQAWAAGALPLLLQACLGLRVDAAAGQVLFEHAKLPPSIDWVRIERLEVRGAHVDLLVTRHQEDVTVTILRRDGHVEIATRK